MRKIRLVQFGGGYAGLIGIHAQCSDGRVFSLEFLGKVGSRKGVDRI